MGRRHRAALDHKQHQQLHATECLRCGQRLGKHRYGDDACPNAAWSTGNGKPQWLNTTFLEAEEIALPEASWR